VCCSLFSSSSSSCREKVRREVRHRLPAPASPGISVYTDAGVKREQLLCYFYLPSKSCVQFSTTCIFYRLSQVLFGVCVCVCQLASCNIDRIYFTFVDRQEEEESFSIFQVNNSLPSLRLVVQVGRTGSPKKYKKRRPWKVQGEIS
jgi:hypothetical protein